MNKQFFVGRPSLINKETFMKRVSDIIDSQVWGNNGYYVQALEEYTSEYFGCQCVAVANASIGLEFAIKSTIPEASTALVPSFTFVATVAALKRLGISPVFGDIDNNYCLDQRELEKPKNWDFTLPVNLFGNLCSSDVFDFAGPKVFDNAHGLGIFNENAGCYLGAEETGVFSLHSTKLAGSGECGIITCQDSNLANRLREMRNFGYKTNNGGREGEVISVGTNAKITEIQAAMSLTQLESLPGIQEHYFEIHKEYERLLPDLIKPKNNYFSNWSYVVAEVPANQRDNIIGSMNKDGIYPRTYFTPVHRMSPYRDNNVRLPNTDRISSRIMCLPTGLSVSKEDVKSIVNSLRRAICQITGK